MVTRIELAATHVNKHKMWRLAGLAGLTLMPALAGAGGFAVSENSASGMGNAFAGGTAIADDASTVVFNPAGMSRLHGTQLVAAGHYISPTGQYRDEGSTDGLGNSLSGSGADAGVDTIILNLYTVSELNEQWRFGMAVHAPFGMSTEYDDDWVGRYHALNSSLTTINFTPSLAYQHSDKLSFGFGLSAQYLDVSLSSAIDFGTLCETQELPADPTDPASLPALPAGTCNTMGLVAQQSDGYAEVSGSNWSYGWNAGLLFSPSEHQRIGLSYRSAVVQDVSGNANFSVPGEAAFLTASSGAFVDTAAQSKLTLPASVSVSYWQQLNNKVALMADATWTNWAVFDELRIKYDNPNQPDSVTTENWRDTMRYSLGMNYTLSDTTLLRFGAAHDQAVVTDFRYRTPRVPDGMRRWLTAGARIKISEDTQINAGYARLFVKPLAVNNTLESSIPALRANLRGSFDASVNIFSLQLTRHF